MIKNKLIYVDMDGVLADFVGSVEEEWGPDMLLDKNISGLWRAIKATDKQLKAGGFGGWFFSLPMMNDSKQLWNFLTSNFSNIEILTSSGSTPSDTPRQKRAWISKNISSVVRVNVVATAKEKLNFANTNTLLIDDKNDTIEGFMAKGGIGITHTSAATTIQTLKVMMENWD